MSVISDKANILITNEDFSELMAENARLQAELAEANRKVERFYEANIAVQGFNRHNRSRLYYKSIADNMNLLAENKQLTERVRVLKERQREFINRLEVSMRMYHNSTEWDCEEYENDLTYWEWMFEALEDSV